MKEYLQPAAQLFRALFIVTLFFVSAPRASAQIMSNEALYANGFKNYNDNNWRYAAVYLFAYEQKNPDAFVSHPTLKKSVVDAYDYAMGRLADDATQLTAYQNAENKNGLGNHQQGLHGTPPALPTPASIAVYRRQ